MQERLFAYYYQELSKGVDVGYSPTFEMYDEALAVSFKKNIADFSAFKATSFKKQLESLLVQDGKITPWSEFKKQADALHIEYNRRWLKTEYHQTVAVANMAQQWQQFEADADLYPNLKYNAVNDGRTREEHRAWDGLVLPIKHKFWTKHLPPNDWGCRCTVTQTDEAVSKEIPEIKNKGAFSNNPAMSGAIFKENTYEKGLDSDGIKESKDLARDKIETLSYERTQIPFKGKGTIYSSNLVNPKGVDFEDVLTCCKHFAELGNETEILPTIHIKSELYDKVFKGLLGSKYEGKCPDFKVGDYFYELEGFEGEANADKFGKMLARGLKQSSRLVLKDDGSTTNHIKKLIYFAKSRGQLIDEVWVFKNNGEIIQVY